MLERQAADREPDAEERSVLAAGIDVDALLEEARREHERSYAEYLVEEIEKARKDLDWIIGPRLKLKTGVPALDDALPGLREGWLVAVIGRDVPAICSFTKSLEDRLLEDEEWCDRDGKRLRGHYRSVDRAEAERLLHDGMSVMKGADVLFVSLREVAAIPTLFQAAKAHDVLLFLEIESHLLDQAGYDESRAAFDYVDVAISAKTAGPDRLIVDMWKNRYGPRAQAQLDS